jgi:hypothetical protein
MGARAVKRKFAVYPGDKFGELTVVEAGVGANVLLKCDCGELVRKTKAWLFEPDNPHTECDKCRRKKVGRTGGFQ